MAGIYVHIPFCHSKCHYCNFFSLATTKYREEMQMAILQEIKLKHKQLPVKQVQSIYFGGGTPSLFPASFYHRFFAELKKYFRIADEAEITIEANPEDITNQYLEALPREINRISIGVQSFLDKELKLLGRKHSASTALNAIKLINASHINNLSIDFIYGIPGSTEDEMRQNWECLNGFDIQHLSAYALTIESGTALDYLRRKERFRSATDEHYEMDYHLMRKYAKHYGFEHYEISNFAKKGFQARHNSAYWSGEPYLGLGPSAHSFTGKIRSWNISAVKSYIDAIAIGQAKTEQEELSSNDRFNELIMTGLRTAKGVSISNLEYIAGKRQVEKMLSEAQTSFEAGHLQIDKGFLFIPAAHWFLCDHITSGLFSLGDEVGE